MLAKVCLHSHSSNSDGSLSPQELLMYLKRHDYNVIAITDHNTISRVENPPDGLLVLEGYEDTFQWHIVHIEDEWYNSTGGLVFLAHPARWGLHKMVAFHRLGHPHFWRITTQKISDVMIRHNCMGVEMFNSGCKQFEVDDYMRKTILLATDDFHRPGGENRSWIELETDSLDKDTVIEKIKRREFDVKH